MSLKSYFVLAAALYGAGCGGEEEKEKISSTTQMISSQHISDAANPPGTAGFYLLVPLADTTPSFSGTFNGGFKTRLKIDVMNLDCNTFAVGSVHNTISTVFVYPAEQLYRANTNVNTLGLTTGNCYRVIPKLDNAQLGFRDAMVTTGTPSTGVKKWTPGSNLSFTFRLENMDDDGDGVLNHVDNCPNTSNPDQADSNHNGIGDACDAQDDDNDGVPNATDNCPTVANPNQADTDGDHVGDACDVCPGDPNKSASAGVCGCGNADTDSDGDGAADCIDSCPSDPNKTSVGTCGCGTPDTDSDGDGVPDCVDGCPADANKASAGVCGCGTADTDSDGDGIDDCLDQCPSDNTKTVPGQCGCGIPDTDTDGDGTANCHENCTP